jgi:MarR family transcriptional regulator, transcriptional regulator for hemolysin
MNPLFQELSYATRRMIKAENEILKKFGITYSQWAFIVYLHHHTSTPLVAVARYYMIKKPAITAMKNKFMEKGWICEEPGRDQREKRISLTVKGQQHFTLINLHIRKLEVDFFQILDAEEQHQLQKMLSRINEGEPSL